MIARALRPFFEWWLGELRAVVPERLRAALRADRKIVLIEIAGESLVVREVSRGAARPVHELSGWSAAAPEALRALARRLVRYRSGGWRLGLRLDDPRILRDRLVLPTAAAENLREVVGLQIERVTPFALDEIVYDCRAMGRGDAEGRLAVEFVLAPADIVRRPLDRLAAAGIVPRFVAVADDDAGSARALDLLAGGRRRSAAAPLPRLNAALAGLAALLLAALVWLPVERERRHAELVEARLAELRVEAREIERLMQELEQAGAMAGFLIARKRDVPSVTRIINDLSALLPDDSWVSELGIRDSTVQIAGESAAASDVVGLIERSPQFGEARPLSPVNRDRDSGRERFNLSFRSMGKGE